MDKLSVFEKICMGISFISATISFLMNITNGHQQYLWQLCVMIWVMVSYMKLRMYERDINK